MLKKLFFLFFIGLSLNSVYAQTGISDLRVDTIRSLPRSEEDTVWFVNYQYWEDVVTRHKLVFKLQKVDLPFGYERIYVEWGDGDGAENYLMDLTDDGIQFEHTYEKGIYDIKLQLSRPYGGIPFDYRFKEFNQDLNKCEVEILTPMPKHHCMEYDQDTFFVRLKGMENNPPQTEYTFSYNVSSALASALVAQEDTLLMADTTHVAGVWRVIMKKPIGQFNFSAGFHMSCVDEGTPYFLFSNTDWTPLYFYKKPDLSAIFGVDCKLPDTIRVCTGSEAFTCNEVFNTMYMDWQGFPAYGSGSQMHMTFYTAENPKRPDWKKVPVTKDKSVIDSAQLIFNVPGYYKVRIVAENFCGRDTLETDSVYQSAQKRPIEVYEDSAGVVLSCLTEQLCSAANQEIVLVDMGRRIKYEEFPSYTFEIYRSGTEVSFNRFDPDIYKDGVQVRYPEASDSTRLRLGINDLSGNLQVKFKREHVVCGVTESNFEVRIGGIPRLTADMLVDSLIAAYGITFQAGQAARCDTFSYTLQNFRNGIDSNNLPIDSLAFIFRRGRGKTDTVLWGKAAGYVYDSITENPNYIAVQAHNFCGWSARQSLDFYTYIRPNVRLIRNGLEENDTLCGMLDYAYRLEGTYPSSYYINTIHTRLDKDFRPVGTPVEASHDDPAWTQSFGFNGALEEKIIFRHGLSPNVCIQELTDTIFTMPVPDPFLYEDSIRYCSEQTEVNTPDLFTGEAEGYSRAAWRWTGNATGWEEAASLPASFGLTATKVDTLYVKLSKSRGCYREDTLVFLPQAAPVFSLLRERDTVCVTGEIVYPVWDPATMVMPGEAGVKTDMLAEYFLGGNIVSSVILQGIGEEQKLRLTEPLPDSVKITLHAYQTNVDNREGCTTDTSRKLILLKPFLEITKTDTLDEGSPGMYDFSRLDGYILSAYVDPSTFSWSKRADLKGNIVGNRFQLSAEDYDCDSLVFYLEGQVNSPYCSGEILKDSLVVYNPSAKIFGGRWEVCDNVSGPLWGTGKAYGYFIEEANLKWRILNEGPDWGSLSPESGFGAIYTPVPGKRTGERDTVKIEMDYGDGLLKDTVYLKINKAPEWQLYRDTLIAKDRIVNVNRISADFFSASDYRSLVIEKLAAYPSNDAFVREDSILDFSAWPLDFGRNFQVKTRIRIVGLPGCADVYTTGIDMLDLVNVQPHARERLTLCEGDSVATSVLFNYEVADVYSLFEWMKEGADGAFNKDSSFYYISGTGNDHRLKVITRKACTFYDGTETDENFRREELAMDYFRTLHNPGLVVDLDADTLCVAQTKAEGVLDAWGIRMARAEYFSTNLFFNGLRLGAGQSYLFPKNAGETDTVRITVELGACGHMDWQTEDTLLLYKQRPMIGGEFTVPQLCGERWTEIGRNTLVLTGYSAVKWEAEGGEVAGGENGAMPYLRGTGDFTDGRITLTVRGAQGCPDESVTKPFSRTILPEISLEDQLVCAEAGQELHIPLLFRKMRESIDRVDWKIAGASLPFLSTGQEEEEIVYTLTAEDVAGTDFAIVAEVYAPGVCADEPTGDTAWIRFRERPGITVLQAQPFVCQGDTLYLGDIVRINGSESVTWKLLSGDGLLTENSVYYIPGEASGEIRLQVKAQAMYGCGNTETAEIKAEIRPAPLPADFTVSQPRCPETDLVFSVPAHPDCIYHWDFADGSAPEEGVSLVHRYGEAGNYPVECRAFYTNGCQRSRREEIAVGAPLEAGLRVLPETEDCRQLVRYVENTTKGYWTYARIQWGDSEEWQEIGEGNPGIMEHRFTNDSTQVLTYPIRLIVGNICQEDTALTTLKVYPLQVKARIGISSEEGYGRCFGESWGFLNRSFGFGEARYEALWTWESGKAYRTTSITDSLVNYTFDRPGDYTITLKVSDKCNSDSVSQVITVLGDDRLDFSAPEGLLCSGRTAEVKLSPQLKDRFSGFVWNWGDGTPAVTGRDSVVHIFPDAGEFTIRLEARSLSEGYCPAVKEYPVKVYATPRAEIGMDPADRGCAPDTIRFFRPNAGEEEEGRQVYWDFGNGVTAATDEVKKVIFQDPGEYRIRLNVVSAAGCADSAFTVVTTLETPVAGFSLSDTLFCTEDGLIRVALENRTAEPEKSSFEWSCNGHLFSRLYQPGDLTPEAVFGPVEIGLLARNNTTGCPSILTKKVVSSRLVKADFTVTPHEICDATPVRFESTSQNGDGARWDMGDGNIRTEGSFDYIYEGSGVYTIRIVANNTDGCVSEKTQTVTVYPRPEADFTWDKDNSVNGLPSLGEDVVLPEVDNGGVRFTNLTVITPDTWGDSVRFEWNFGDGSGVSAGKSPYHHYRNNGTYEVLLKAVSLYGCTDSISDIVSISAVKGLYIPTAFAPALPDENMGEGGDYRGAARFQPKGVGLYSYKIQVYDAWGGCVWSSDKLENGHPAEYWDGTFNGGPLPKGNYTWKVSAVFLDGSVWDNGGGKTEGNVLLIR